jgi:hypothetical protein
VNREPLEDVGVPWKVRLGDGRHDAAGVRRGDREPNVVAYLQDATNPCIFDETRLGRIGDGFMRKPDVEPALMQLAQLIECATMTLTGKRSLNSTGGRRRRAG